MVPLRNPNSNENYHRQSYLLTRFSVFGSAKCESGMKAQTITKRISVQHKFCCSENFEAARFNIRGTQCIKTD